MYSRIGADQTTRCMSAIFFSFEFLISHLKVHSLVTEMQMMYMSLWDIRPGCVHVQSGQPEESSCPELLSTRRQTIQFFHIAFKICTAWLVLDPTSRNSHKTSFDYITIKFSC